MGEYGGYDYDFATHTRIGKDYTPNLVFRVEGTNSVTDFVDLDAKISFIADTMDGLDNLDLWDTYPSTKGGLEFRNVEAKLSSAVYTNVNEAYFHNAIVSGNGASHVDFFFYGNGSGVKPGNSIGTFFVSVGKSERSSRN